MIVTKNAKAMLRMSEVLEKTKDKPDYYRDLMDCGQVINDILYIEPKNFQRLNEVVRKHNPHLSTVKEKTPKGLGDLVEKVAKPIAKTIDFMIGTNLTKCQSCGERKEWLNKKVPLSS